LALSAHLVVVVWRHLEQEAPSEPAASDRTDDPPVVQSAEPLPSAPAEVVRIQPARKPSRPVPGADAARAVELHRANPARSLRDIARELGTNPKNIERWTRAARNGSAAPAATPRET
jgi:hypothetical protein